jgi:DNA-binding NarL/FixJ family response regulator
MWRLKRGLMARQVAVVEGIRKGNPNKMIAHELNLRESTVKVHIRNIMKKLNSKNRTELSYIANKIETDGGL